MMAISLNDLAVRRADLMGVPPARLLGGLPGHRPLMAALDGFPGLLPQVASSAATIRPPDAGKRHFGEGVLCRFPPPPVRQALEERLFPGQQEDNCSPGARMLKR
jgi:hypothetical protein